MADQQSSKSVMEENKLSVPPPTPDGTSIKEKDSSRRVVIVDNEKRKRKRKKKRGPSKVPTSKTSKTKRRDSDEERIDGVEYHKPLYGIPMEEVDTSVSDTFCVITKKFNKHYVCRFAADKSLYLFDPLHPLRKLAIFIVTHRYFDTLIIFTILCNCATLATSVNEFDENGLRVRAPYDIETDYLEYVFLAIYCAEMFLKIISKGFILNKYSYLRNCWNIIDFVVVCSGIITTLDTLFIADVDDTSGHDPASNDLQILRIFRVLRAVKTVSVLPGLRTMINALLSSAVQLLEVMTLNFFCLMIFALFALEIYMGKLRQKCVLIPNGLADPQLTTIIDGDRMWYEWINDNSHWAERDPAYPKEEPQPCGNDSTMRVCPDGYVCLNVGQNPDDGWTSFDNLGLSMLSTFQLLTTDFWERPYELVLSTCGPWSILFFLVVLFFGSFYLLNLMLAVVALSYETEAAKKKLGSLTKNEKLHINRASSTFSFDLPYKLTLNTVTHYRLKTNAEKEEARRRSSMKKTNIHKTTSLSGEPNAKKGLGDAILGLLGRRLTLDSELKRLDITDEDGVPIRDADISIQIDPVQKSKLKARLSSDSESDFNSIAESHSVASKLDLSKNYPHTDTRARRSQRKIRRIAMVFRKILKPVVNHPMFDAFVTICIIINTIFFAMEHHGQSETVKDVLEYGNNFFMVVFSLEALLKLLALQKEYFTAGWNIFDIVIVFISYLDTFLTDSLNLSFLRSMRLLRVFKLAQSWITMKVLLNIIFSTFGALGNLTLLLLIVIYIFAVLGMQLVGGEYSPQAFDAINNKDNFPRWNFSNFGYAFMMVFRIICGEWIESMWECFVAQKKNESSYKCFLIYFPTLIFGNFIVLNLFLALLLDSFNTDDLKAARNKEVEASGKAQNLKKIVGLLMIKTNDLGHHKKADHRSKDGPKTSTMSIRPKASTMIMSSKMDFHPQGVKVKEESIARVKFKAAAKKVMVKNRVAVAERRIEQTNALHAAAKVATQRKRKPSAAFGLIREHTPSGSAEAEAKLLGNCIPQSCLEINCRVCQKIQGIDWTKWDNVRARAARIVGHSSFEWTILAFIFLSSITLCFEDVNLESNPTLKDILFYLNCLFCIIFIVEMILKWFAFGLWGYISNSWCVLDFFIVVISVVTLYFDIKVRVEHSGGVVAKSHRSNFAALKALRTLRALRPLRAISRWEGMKIVVNALMYAIPLIFNVFLVCLLFWLIFSIMGVQLYKGKFFKCVDSGGEIVDVSIAPTKQLCCAKSETHKYSWININPNFDNVLEGYLSLFQIATFEGWMELMAAAVDAVDVDQQPIREYNTFNYIFFVIFIVFGGFFTLNLFIGVMVDNFGMLKKKYEGNLVEIFLTPSQRHYYTALKKLGQKKPKKIINRPSNKYLTVFYDLAVSRRFEITVFTMIFLNLLVLSFESYNQSSLRNDMFVSVNSFFTTIYIIEAAIKILAFRQYYFTVAWNIFDLVLVIASMVDLLVVDTTVDFPIPPTMLRVFRIFRIGRVLRLVKGAKGIRKLLEALVVSMPALGNIGALIGLITFIYAILGMASFSGAAKFGAVDQVVNWDTFMSSCIVLLRLMLAAGWNDVLEGLVPAYVECGTYRKMSCGLEGEPDCPNRAVVIGYFVTYILIVFLIIINMYTAIILENYVEASQEQEGGIVEDDLEMFYTRWSRYDPTATQFIGFEELCDFLAGLDPPLRVPKPNIVAIVAFNLPICRGNKIHCLDILHALIKHVLGHIEDSDEFHKLKEKMERRFLKQFPTRKLLDIISSTRIWKIQQNAAIIIQRAWRAHYKRNHPQIAGTKVNRLVSPSGSGNAAKK